MAPQMATSKTAARAAKAIDTTAAPDSGQGFQAARMPAPADRDQAIREAAYALFEARGCEPGHEVDDWLKAEAQVQQAHAQSASSAGVGPVAH